MLYLLLSAFLAGCIEEFNPDISGYENLLVVDGVFTDSDSLQMVTLSRLRGYYDEEDIMVSGAVVMISDDEGSTAYYQETKPGIYQVESSEMPAVEGKSYQLRIELPGGGTYVSSFEKLNPPGTLDSIYYEIKVDDPLLTGYGANGIQLYLDAHGDPSGDGFYGWDYHETWEFVAPYGTGDHFTCWSDQQSTEINVVDASQFQDEYINQRKLNFIPFSINKLYINYSIIVEQHSLTGAAYEYYLSLRKLMQAPASLFDQVPVEIYGNIENINDPEEKVMGFFRVSSVSRQRIFIGRSQLPRSQRISSGHEKCIAMDYPDYSISKIWYYVQTVTGSPFYVNWLGCSDCRIIGSNERPEFWIDDDGF